MNAEVSIILLHFFDLTHTGTIDKTRLSFPAPVAPQVPPEMCVDSLVEVCSIVFP